MSEQTILWRIIEENAFDSVSELEEYFENCTRVPGAVYTVEKQVNYFIKTL